MKLTVGSQTVEQWQDVFGGFADVHLAKPFGQSAGDGQSMLSIFALGEDEDALEHTEALVFVVGELCAG